MNRIARTAAALLAVGLVLSMAAPAAGPSSCTGRPDRATLAPASCTYADSGWQYQGQWSYYLGTPIAPNYFITAKHVGGSVGNMFTYNGQAYTTTAAYASPSSDLTIWKVSSGVRHLCPAVHTSNEVSQTMTVYGRGTARGSAVTVGGQTKGWTWGAFDHVQSWGSNTVDDDRQWRRGDRPAALLQVRRQRRLLRGQPFGGRQRGRGVHQGRLDLEAGGHQLRDGWALQLHRRQTDAGFSAAIFDQGGLYVGASQQLDIRVPTRRRILPAGPMPRGSPPT